MAKSNSSKRKKLNTEINIDANSDEERDIEIGVVGRAGGRTKLTHNVHTVNKRPKIATAENHSELAEETMLPAPGPSDMRPEAKKKKQVCLGL
jgi:hypothetical protein